MSNESGNGYMTYVGIWAGICLVLLGVLVVAWGVAVVMGYRFF